MKMKMKNSTLLVTAFLISSQIWSQQISSTYRTNSVTNLIVKFSEYDDKGWEFDRQFNNIDLTKKYFNNAIGAQIVRQTTKKLYIDDITTEISKYQTKGKFIQSFGESITQGIVGTKAFLQPIDSIGIALGDFLENQSSVPSSIIKVWAEKDNNGNYFILQERSQLALNSNELRNNVDANKLDAFRSLFDRNYILLFDFGDIERISSRNGDTKKFAGLGSSEGDYSVDVNTYIYKLEINDHNFQQIKRQFGKGDFSNVDIPIKYVGRYLTVANIPDPGRQSGTPMRNSKNVSNKLVMQSDIYLDLAQKAYDEIIEIAEMHIEDFKVRSKVITGFPNIIQAEIGKKENVKRDQRYYVYQNVLDTKTKETTSKFIGAIRAKNIAQNDSSLVDENGQFKRSSFYQIQGGNVKEGMFLVQESDFGVGLSLGLKTFPNLAPLFRIEYRISPYLHKMWEKSPFINSNIFLDVVPLYLKIGRESELTIMMGLGVSSKFYLTKYFNPEPYIVLNFVQDVRFLNLGLRSDYALNKTTFIIPEVSITPRFFGSENGVLGFNLGCYIKKEF